MAEVDARRRLEALEEAIFSGAKTVSYDGKSVEYMPLSEMISLRNTLRRELGIPVPGRRSVATFRSGF